MMRISRSSRTSGMLVLSAAVVFVAVLASCRRQDRPASGGAPSPGEGAAAQALTSPTGLEMVLVPAGQFAMGSEKEIDSRPVRQVSVSRFYMSRYEVTQDVYEKVTGANPSKYKDKRNPVERVRWREAIEFCNALSVKEGLRPCYDLKTRTCDFAADGYRLPTEAEWEYACRAGGEGDYTFGNDAKGLDAHGWFKANAGGRPHPVGKKRPNAFKLYDLSGNVREWCNDWYQVDAYKQGAGADPPGPASGEKKVLRGGAWSVTAKSCTSWSRFCDDPGFTDACFVNADCGFRVVRRPPGSRE